MNLSVEEKQSLNLLLADFCGWKLSKSRKTLRRNLNSSPYRISDIHYCDSYEWLFECIERIKSIWHPEISTDVSERIILRRKNKVLNIKLHSSFEEILYTIKGFVDWFNNIKQ